MINILQVTGSVNIGGAETFLMNILRSIDVNKYQYIFLCYGDKEMEYEAEIKRLGGKVMRTPGVEDVGAIKHILNIRKILKDEKIDIIHAHTYFNSMFSLIAGKLSKVKVRIVHSHSTKSGFNEGLFKKTYYLVSKIAINHLSTIRLACENNAGLALFTKDFKVIHNGIILENFKYNNSLRKKYRNSLNISDDTVVIGHVGRFEKVKNHDFLIDILNEYKEINHDSILLLLGGGSLRKHLELKIKKLNLDKNVIFLGKKLNANEFYNVMDYFVFPSLYEGLPLTLIEAQTNGLNCLISDSIEKKVKITDSITFYSLNRSAKDWAKKINIMNVLRLDNYPSMLKSEYNIEKVVNNLEVIYSGESND